MTRVDTGANSSPAVHPWSSCELRSLHLVTYENGLRLQEMLVALRQQEKIPDQLLLLEHPSIITLGRGGDRGNLLVTPDVLASRDTRYYESSRGGDITWHGPGQLIGYPIIHLGEGRRDVRKYVSRLEEVLIRSVAEFGIGAHRIEGKHGIWVGNEKLAAIGVRIARWVTSHGFALNADPDLSHFDLITPCGLGGSGVTSIARLTGKVPAPIVIRSVVARHFSEIFEREIEIKNETIRLVKVIIHDGERLLLLHRKPQRGNFWQPVTGTLQDGENDLDAARREIREETGHVSEPDPLDLTQSFPIESSYLAERHPGPIVASEVLYTANVPRGSIVIDEDEHDDFGWFTLPEALETIRWSDDRDAIEHFGRMFRAPATAS